MDAAELVTTWFRKLRNERTIRAWLMGIAGVFILVFIGLFYSSASASGSSPQVIPVYSNANGSTPSAYVITATDGTMFFCAATQGATVYSCQQLPRGGH